MTHHGDVFEGSDGGLAPDATASSPLPPLLATNSPTWGVPDHGAVERLAASLGEGGVVRTKEHRGELTVVVPAARIVDALTYLRDVEGYDYLSQVMGTDYLGYEGDVAGYWGGGDLRRDLNQAGSWGGKPIVPSAPGEARFALNYDLMKLLTVADDDHRRLRVQVWVDDGEPVPTVVPVYPSADYHEREVYDFFGIPFEGHPNLRRLFMPEDWGGHPQRKDYPMGGEPVQFSDTQYDGGEQ